MSFEKAKRCYTEGLHSDSRKPFIYPFIHPRCAHLALCSSPRYDKNPCLQDDYDLAGEIEDKVIHRPFLNSEVSSVPENLEAEKEESSSKWQVPVRPSGKLSGSM